MAKRKDDEMSHEELLHELRIMRKQISHHRALTKEMNLLDAEFWQIYKLDKLNSLPYIRIPNNAPTSDT